MGIYNLLNIPVAITPENRLAVLEKGHSRSACTCCQSPEHFVLSAPASLANHATDSCENEQNTSRNARVARHVIAPQRLLSCHCPGQRSPRDRVPAPETPNDVARRTSNQPPKTTDFRRQPRLCKGHCSGDITKADDYSKFAHNGFSRFSLVRIQQWPTSTALVPSIVPRHGFALRFQTFLSCHPKFHGSGPWDAHFETVFHWRQL